MCKVIQYHLFKKSQSCSLPERAILKVQDILLKAPFKNSFLPERYNISATSYEYAAEIQLINQLYIALQRCQLKGDVTPLFNFIKRTTMENDYKLYSVYNSQTEQPVTKQESEKVYLCATLLCLELDELQFAEQFYKQYLVNKRSDVYYLVDKLTKGFLRERANNYLEQLILNNSITKHFQS